VYVWQEILKVAAYAVALPYCWRIRGDSTPHSPMWRAWTLMGLSALLSMVRHSYEVVAEWGNWALTARSWRQVVIVASLLALTGGLLELGRAFRDAGMAPRWRRVDWVWLLLIACLAIPVVIHRERMGDSASDIAAMRYLQSLSSVLLAVPVIIALGLHRISRSMTGGRWAVALRWMVAFLLVRLVNLYLVTALAMTGDWMHWSNVAAPWLFTMAAVERWSVTRAAVRMRQQIFLGANKPA
jgi:hypothetical protein